MSIPPLSAIAANGVVRSPTSTAAKSPDMAIDDETPSPLLDTVEPLQTEAVNGVDDGTERQVESLRRRSYTQEYIDLLKEQVQWLKEQIRLKEELRSKEFQRLEEKRKADEKIKRLEEELRFEQRQRLEEKRKADEKIRRLEEELRSKLGSLSDDDLEVDFTICIREEGGEASWRMCKLDTGSPIHNLIASSALKGLHLKRRDYTGDPIIGIGGKPSGITPKEEVELEWHVKGMTKTYTTWFTVWEEVNEGVKVPLGVDVLMGRKTIAEIEVILRNRPIYLISSI